MTASVIRLDAERGNKIASPIFDKISGTPLDNDGPYLDKFKNLPWGEQLVLVDRDLLEMSKDMEFHELVNIFPLLDGVALNELAEDVKSNGLNQAIVTYQGKILDGRTASMPAAAHASSQGSSNMMATIPSATSSRST